MNDRTFLQVQAIQLRELLDNSRSDPILAPQLQQRLEEVEQALQELEQANGALFAEDVVRPPRVAVFLSGGGVDDSRGVRPSLAGEALIQYEKMFVEQALHDERAAARAAGRQRRRRGTPSPSLLFTGTPRGSFGLEFVPQRTEDRELLEVHAKSLKNVADALLRVTSGGALDDLVGGLPSGMLPPLKRFLNVLAQSGAELRLAFSDAPSKTIAAERVHAAAQRMERELVEEEITEPGVFRGLTRETVLFDFIGDDLGLISGTLADDLTEEDFDRVDELTNRRCVAKLQRTTIVDVSGSPRVSYVLLDAQPAD